MPPATPHRIPAPTPTPTPPPTPTPTPPTAPARTPNPPPASRPAYDHIVVIVMENHSLENVLGNTSEAPYLNSLAASNGLATGYSGVSHPSLPNYLAMVGGSTFGVTDDCTGCFQSGPSVADRLEAAGKSWNASQAGMPSPAFVCSSA